MLLQIKQSVSYKSFVFSKSVSIKPLPLLFRMKVALVLALVLATVLAAPQQNGLKFRNMYKNVVPGAKAKGPIGGRIINGEIAEPHSIPYQAFLTVYSLYGGWYCGGSLITVNYVLTAGHCGYEGTDAEIILGAQTALHLEDDQLWAISSEIIVHPGFDMNQILSDIALFKLSSPVTLNNIIGLSTLPSRADVSNTFEGETAKVSGWGLTDGNGDTLSEELRWVSNPLISNQECNDIYGIVQDYQVCMSGDGGRSSCNGDSGGPVTVQVDGSPVQVGIVSYGVVGCRSGFPSAFTRTTSFLDWIEEHSDLVVN